MTVSVVVPAFNAESFVVQAVTSILCQSYRDVDVIVVDDGSEDRTADVVREIDDERVRLISTANAGVSAARNTGIAAANSEYVAFLDADDGWYPQKLDRQLEILQRDRAVVAVGSRLDYIGARAGLGAAGIAVGVADRARIASGGLVPFPISSLVVRRCVIDEVGLFDESLARNIPGQVEDLDFLARLAQQGVVTTCDETLGWYRIHGSAASQRHFHSQRMGTRYVRARLAARAEGFDLSWEEFARSYHPNLRQRRDDHCQQWYRTAGMHLASRRTARGVGYFVAAAALNPAYVVRRVATQRGLSTRRGR